MDSCVAGYFEMLLHCAADPDDELLLHAACWPAETCSQDWLHQACSILNAATATCCSSPTCRFGEQYLGQHVAVALMSQKGLTFRNLKTLTILNIHYTEL